MNKNKTKRDQTEQPTNKAMNQQTNQRALTCATVSCTLDAADLTQLVPIRLLLTPQHHVHMTMAARLLWCGGRHTFGMALDATRDGWSSSYEGSDCNQHLKCFFHAHIHESFGFERILEGNPVAAQFHLCLLSFNSCLMYAVWSACEDM